jgi:hypothetical protein
MISVDVPSPAAPAAVLAALRAHAGEWRQSQLPPELWRDGLALVECRVNGATCTITTWRRWYGRGDRALQVRALAIVAPANGASVVRVRIGYAVPEAALPTAGAAVVTLIAVAAYLGRRSGS